MAGVLLNQGEQILLEAFVNKTAPQDLVLRLFTNNVTPAETDTEATYTEDSGDGYAAVPLIGSGGWVFAAGNPSTLTYPECNFTYTGTPSKNVYGYFITQETSGKAVIGDRFSDGPYSIANAGDEINVTPVLTA